MQIILKNAKHRLGQILIQVALLSGSISVCAQSSALSLSPRDIECSSAANALVALYPLKISGFPQELLRGEISKFQLSEAIKSRLAGILNLFHPKDAEYNEFMLKRGRYEHAFHFYISCAQ